MSKYINSAGQNHEIAEKRRCVCLSSTDVLNSTLEWFSIKYTTIGNKGVLTELALVQLDEVLSSILNSAHQSSHNHRKPKCTHWVCPGGIKSSERNQIDWRHYHSHVRGNNSCLDTWLLDRKSGLEGHMGWDQIVTTALRICLLA